MNEVKESVEELRNKKSRDNRELLDRSANMIERLAKELCDKSGCHHKCNDTKDCVVEDEAREYLPSTLTNEVKVSTKDKQIEEMARFMCSNYAGEGMCGDGEKCDFDCWAYREAKHLYNAGYRKQSDNVIELPCKVGDKAYHLTSIDTLDELNVAEIFEGKVCSISKDEKTLLIFCRYDNGLNFWYTERDIGRELFLAKEEAEQALAKMKGGEQDA